MRRLLGLAVVAVLLFGNLSCSTTQPAAAGPQTFSVQVISNAAVKIFDIWEQWVDTNGDGTPDLFIGHHDLVASRHAASSVGDRIIAPAGEPMGSRSRGLAAPEPCGDAAFLL